MYEKLVEEAEKENIEVVEISFRSKNIKGLYSDNVIAINKKLSDKEKACIIAEEIGHYYKTFGNILDQEHTVNVKEERKARIWAYKRLVCVTYLISAYKEGIRNRYELSEYLNVTESFLEEAIKYYKELYGDYLRIDRYVIYFEPLSILEMI